MHLTFEQYIEPRKSPKTGKTIPGKYVAEGVEYLTPRGAQIELGKEYECEVETTQNGNFTNHVVKNLFPVRQLEPPSVQPVKIAPTREASAHIEQHTQPAWAPAAQTDKDRLISRQVAFKGAIEIVTANITAGHLTADPVEAVDYFTEVFFALLLDEAKPASNIRRPDAPVVSPSSHPTR